MVDWYLPLSQQLLRTWFPDAACLLCGSRSGNASVPLPRCPECLVFAARMTSGAAEVLVVAFEVLRRVDMGIVYAATTNTTGDK